MATNTKHSLSSSFSSYIDYTFSDDSESSYTIDDISLVLDSQGKTTPSQTMVNTPRTSRRARIQYGGSGRRHNRQTAANDSSIFCEVTPLPLPKSGNFLDERISDSIISIDQDISYDDSYLRDRVAKPGAVSTETFRRFSPRRVAVKLMSTSSKRAHKRQAGVTKTRSTPQRQNGLLKFLFLGKYGCLNKVLD